MTKLRSLLTVIAAGAAVVAASPHTLGSGGVSTLSVVADIAPWIGITIAWEILAIRAAASSARQWAMPSDVFRAAIIVGGVLVVLARVELFTAPPIAVRPTALAATTAEDLIYGLGIVALGGLAAFAVTRTLLRPTLRFQQPPTTARDLSLRTRFVLVAAATSFATAGVLLDVLVDFERTPDDVLIAYIVLAAGLVAFATFIGWLLGSDTARGVSAIARRLRDAAATDLVADRPPLLAADEIAELAVAAMELERRIRREAIRTAAGNERDRIARELHDGVAKSVSILALEAATAARATGDIRPALSRIERLARLLSEELRTIVTDVRSREDGRPFAEAVRDVVERHEPAELTIEGAVDRIDTLARFEVLRIVDEALANARRHAHAERVRASVSVYGDEVRLEVEDDGAGVGVVDWDGLARAGRYGLVGIRERTSLLRGTLTVDRGPLGGTLVRVAFPLARA